jgi:hypothetical protein
MKQHDFKAVRWIVSLWVGACMTTVLGADALPAPVYVWWEGETFANTNVPNPVQKNIPGNKNEQQRSKLSGGAWLTPSGPESETPYFVKYEVAVPASSNRSRNAPSNSICVTRELGRYSTPRTIIA